MRSYDHKLNSSIVPYLIVIGVFTIITGCSSIKKYNVDELPPAENANVSKVIALSKMIGVIIQPDSAIYFNENGGRYDFEKKVVYGKSKSYIDLVFQEENVEFVIIKPYNSITVTLPLQGYIDAQNVSNDEMKDSIFKEPFWSVIEFDSSGAYINHENKSIDGRTKLKTQRQISIDEISYIYTKTKANKRKFIKFLTTVGLLSYIILDITDNVD